jgi:transcriptional regulator with XRE-family HTH domain
VGKARQTVERRQLGLALRRLREHAGLSQVEAAAAINRTHPRISKVEDGAGTIGQPELEHLLDVYDAPAAERATMLALAVEARKRQPRGSVTGPYTDTLPGSFQRLADLEQDARAIYTFEPGVIPGYLQSGRYMRAVMRACDGIFWREFGPEGEDRVGFRQARQSKILGAAEPKSLCFVCTKDALVDDGLHSDVMREQLQHLLALAKKHPNIELRVLSAGALDNPAPNGGLTVLDFGDSAPMVGFAHAVYGPSSYFSEDEDTAALLRAFRRIQGLALSPARSLKLIRDSLKEF